MQKLKFICDERRHLICVPYSIDNLHLMAEELGIKRGWFHKNHYDIPKERNEEIKKKCRVVSPKLIVEIIRSPEYAETLLSEPIKPRPLRKKNFKSIEVVELEYNGFINR